MQLQTLLHIEKELFTDAYLYYGQIERNSLNSTASLQHSARALRHATHAAFNHEMLALLYFPDEHKWAVYTPLFGPVAVPLVLALLKEFKEWRARRGRKVKAE